MRGRPTPLASLLGGAAYGGPYRHLPEWPSRAPQVTRAWSSSQPHFKTFFCDYLTGAQRIRVSGGKPIGRRRQASRPGNIFTGREGTPFPPENPA